MGNEELPFYQQSAEQVIHRLGSNVERGLTKREAAERLIKYGKNELPHAPPPPWWLKFLAQFQNPLTFLLLAATAISFVVWLVEQDSPIPYEALTILSIVILNALLGYFQENRAEQAVQALQAMAAPTARVLRDGEPHQIPATEVVPGDILLIEEGDTIPADGRVIESIALQLAESALTGESTPVSKNLAPLADQVGIADQKNMVFGGTAVVSGRGRAVVTATGASSEIGQIAETLEETREEPTPLQKELDRVGHLLGRAVIAISLIIGLTTLFVDKIQTLDEAVEVLLLAVSLAVAAVPEGLTAITTIVLSLGMQRMARRHVIVRKLSAVETLGSTTHICTDKTGTLTRNEMTVRTVVTAGGRVEISGTGYAPEGSITQGGKPVTDPELLEEVEKTLRAAHLANNATLVERGGRWLVQGDPTEGALHVAALKVGVDPASTSARFKRVGEVPFTSERKLMTTAHADRDKARLIVFSKGAPDVLLARCTHERVGSVTIPLIPARRTEILETVDLLADQALRTLGVAFRTLELNQETGAYLEQAEQELVWLGIVGMIDPPREEAKESVRLAQQAGIRVIMITGDHPKTAAAIAAELHIISPGARIVTGAELQHTGEAALRRLVEECSVYARVSPEHKLRIVRALKANGAIVAMTGDGVNDATALKTADIGVAMGITGTDVSKGAADMILTDDNFASIVAAVEEGRSIFDNIRKFLRYLLSSNVGEVLTMFLGVVFAGVIGLVAREGSSLIVPLMATQILWINLLTDSGPALALGLEPSDPYLMVKPPRNPKSHVVTTWMWFNILLVGLVMALGTLLVMDWSLPGGLIAGQQNSLTYAQTMGFTTLVFFQLFNVLNARSDELSAFRNPFGNRWLWVAIAISFALQVLVVNLPFLQLAFGTTSLSLEDWGICIAVGSSVLVLGELIKFFRRRLPATRSGRPLVALAESTAR